MLSKITWYSSGVKTSKEANILLGGDLCPIRRYEDKILKGDDIFDKCIIDKMKSSDLFVANLETPICNIKEGSGFSVNAAVGSYLKKNGLNVAGLANNHIRDKGDRGILQTIDTLRKNSISFVGGGKNEKRAERMLVKKINGFKVGILALAEKEFNLADESRPGAAALEPYKVVARLQELRTKVDFLLLFLHSGDEFILTPTERVRKIYRMMIDYGADAVVGHHPHVPQGIEKYKGKWIAYSLGNLVFDSDYVSTYKHTDHGFLLEFNISRHKVNSINLYPYFLRKNFVVQTASKKELKWYKTFLKKISRNITDEKRFQKECEKNTIWKFEEFTRKHLTDFKERFPDEKDDLYLKLIANLFQCPTHVESLAKVFELVKMGKIKRKISKRN